MRDTGGCHHAIFGEMRAQRVDCLRALTHQQVAGPVRHRSGLLLLGLRRHEPRRRPRRRLGDRLGIRHLVLLPLHEELHLGRRDQLDRVTEGPDRPRPMAHASIATRHGRCAEKNFTSWPRDSLRRKTTDPSAAAP